MPNKVLLPYDDGCFRTPGPGSPSMDIPLAFTLEYGSLELGLQTKSPVQ